MNTLKEQNGKYYQEVEVVMIATKQRHSDIELDETLQLATHKGYVNKNGQHLYIISNEDIKEGDWYVSYMLDISDLSNILTVPDTIKKANFNNTNKFIIELYSKYCKKIIATTDESLKIDNDITNQTSVIWDKRDIERVIVGSKSLPKPSDSFISKYIEEYNAGRTIANVLVEYEVGKSYSGNSGLEVKQWLKIDSNNQITIKKVKDSYSREEVIEVLHNSLDAHTTKHTTLRQVFVKQLNNWIKENL